LSAKLSLEPLVQDEVSGTIDRQQIHDR